MLSPQRYLQLETALPIALVLVLGVTTILSRPLLPIDETRYITVAWEMHVSGDYLVSHVNGQTYAHKPPLLFWLINLVWWFTGASATSARLLSVVFSAVSVLLTRRLARQVFPHQQSAVVFAPLIQVSSMLWMLFSPLLMFDVLLLVWVQTGVQGILNLSQRKRISGVILLAIGIGAGTLTKGPVILVHLLPLALAGPWWCDLLRKRSVGYFTDLVLGILFGAAIGLAWAITSALMGGEAYAEELLWGQTAGRVVTSFAHREPWWWYLPLIPLCLLPWTLFGTAWLNPKLQTLSPPSDERDEALLTLSWQRFIAAWGIGSLFVLSCVSGKQIHYIIPLLPAFALFAAQRIVLLSDQTIQRIRILIGVGTIVGGVVPLTFNHVQSPFTTPFAGIYPSIFCIPLCLCGLVVIAVRLQDIRGTVMQISSAAVIFMSILSVGLSVSFWPGFDVTPLAQQVRGLEEAQTPVAWYGSYHGQLQFAGRLRKPIAVLPTAESLKDWVQQNPQGRVIYPAINRIPSVQINGYREVIEFRSEIRRGKTADAAEIVRFLPGSSVSTY